MTARAFRTWLRGGEARALRVCLAGACVGCAGSGTRQLPVGATSESAPDAFAELSNPLATYEAMGFVTGVREFSAVGRFAFLAGPGDSTLVLFGISIPNTALQFRRADTGYVARYQVTLDFRPGDATAPIRISEDQQVRVGAFRETGRREESVIFQTRHTLAPGDYAVDVELRDTDSGKGFRDAVDLRVPHLGPQGARLGDPILVYRVSPRSSLSDPPSLILNPRATIPFGRGSLLVYLEGYGDAEATAIEIADAENRILWSDTATLQSAGPVRNAVVSIVADDLPVGALQLRARLLPSGGSSSSPILIGLSERWILSNFEEILSLLRYAATPDELDSLRLAPPEQRAERWLAFWTRHDPVPSTPENEFLDEYLTRVREANRLFGEQQRAGWLTNRGEVFITLGAPDQVFTTSEIGPGSRVRWVYDRSLGFEVRLDFVDRSGFGDYELSPESWVRFRNARNRVRG